MVSLSNHDGTKETKGYQFINYLIGKSSFQFINLSPIQTPSYHPSTGSGWIYTPSVILCEASMVSLSNHDGTKETKGYQLINCLIGKSSFQFINLSPIQTPSYHFSTGSGWMILKKSCKESTHPASIIVKLRHGNRNVLRLYFTMLWWIILYGLRSWFIKTDGEAP